jgi:hypothetical protein
VNCVAPVKDGRGRGSRPMRRRRCAHTNPSPRLAWCVSANSFRVGFTLSRLPRAIGKLVRMGEAGRSLFGRRRCAGVAAGSRVCCRHGAKSHTHTSPQTSTRLSPGVAGGWRLFVVMRRSRKPAPVSRLEPHRYHSNEGHPPTPMVGKKLVVAHAR